MLHENKPGTAAGFRLLWRRQSVLWWIFGVNLICGALGAAPAFMRLRGAIGQNLAGEPLVYRFDLGMFWELGRLPNISLLRFTTTSFLFVFVFFVFMLFVTGGVLQTYREDRRLRTGEFFAASGTYFWRFVRLLLLSIIPFVFVSMVYQGLDKMADRMGDRAIADQVGIFLGWGVMLVFLLLALAVRLWFDIAQVRAVAQDERRMWRNVWRSWRITWHSFGGLYWMYFRIALVAWITLLLGMVIWTKLPATATGAVFLVLQLIVFAQVATRLWQLASATTWYQRHAELVPADVVEFTTPPPQEIVDAEPASTGPEALAPKAPEGPATLPPDSGPELPPADGKEGS
jgi:hypothetical protein